MAPPAEGERVMFQEEQNDSNCIPYSSDRRLYMVRPLPSTNQTYDVAYVLQKLLLIPKKEEEPQRHAIFKIRCTIQGKVCDVIIDSGSSKNIVSRSLVKILKLRSEPHSTPYKIGWVMKGIEITVKETSTFTFSIGKTYQTQITCDIIDMDACHVILGRLWQFDN